VVRHLYDTSERVPGFACCHSTVRFSGTSALPVSNTEQ
jgi:hypothetical protein